MYNVWIFAVSKMDIKAFKSYRISLNNRLAAISNSGANTRTYGNWIYIYTSCEHFCVAHFSDNVANGLASFLLYRGSILLLSYCYYFLFFYFYFVTFFFFIHSLLFHYISYSYSFTALPLHYISLLFYIHFTLFSRRTLYFLRFLPCSWFIFHL